jgi:hypothetical protein
VAKFYPNGTTVLIFDDATGGTVQSMQAYIKSITPLAKELMPLDTTHLVDTAERTIAGIQVGSEITVEGDYDNAAFPAQHALMKLLPGTARSHKQHPIGTSGTAPTFSAEILWLSYQLTTPNKESVGYVLKGRVDSVVAVS